MDQVHVVRHKVLVEGRTQRSVARELGIARVTVRKYLIQAVAVRCEPTARGRPIWEAVGPRVEALLAEVGAVDGREAAADRDAAARVAPGGGPPDRRDVGPAGGGGVEAPAARGDDSADVSGGRSGRGRFL